MTNKRIVTIEIKDEEYHAFRSALLLNKDHPAYESELDYQFDAEVNAVRSLFDKIMVARQTQSNGVNVDAKKCHSCMRPFKKLKNEERARSYAGTGHEKQVANKLPDMSRACKIVYDYLESYHGSWISSTKLREILNGGDGPRRARQLRDEWAIPIEVKMQKEPGKNRQAYYRIHSALDNAFSLSS